MFAICSGPANGLVGLKVDLLSKGTLNGMDYSIQRTAWPEKQSVPSVLSACLSSAFLSPQLCGSSLVCYMGWCDNLRISKCFEGNRGSQFKAHFSAALSAPCSRPLPLAVVVVLWHLQKTGAHSLSYLHGYSQHDEPSDTSDIIISHHTIEFLL